MKEEILKPGELIEPGKRLKSVREELGLKHKQLAKTLDLSPGYASDIEKIKNNPEDRGEWFLLITNKIRAKNLTLKPDF